MTREAVLAFMCVFGKSDTIHDIGAATAVQSRAHH